MQIDKYAHLGIGGLIAACTTAAFALQQDATGWKWLELSIAGALITFILSVVKEMSDATFDWQDIAAAMVGCAIWSAALTFGILLKYIMIV